jgi:hypothetical protein
MRSFIALPTGLQQRKYISIAKCCVALYPLPSYSRGIILAGILFLRRISDNRLVWTISDALFQTLCGTAALTNLILVTTMWDTVKEEMGLKREKELCSGMWKSMLELGCRTARFANTFDSAWRIVKLLADNPRRIPLALQVEMVDKQQRFPSTSLGLFLSKSQRPPNPNPLVHMTELRRILGSKK